MSPWPTRGDESSADVIGGRDCRPRRCARTGSGDATLLAEDEASSEPEDVFFRSSIRTTPEPTRAGHAVRARRGVRRALCPQCATQSSATSAVTPRR